MSYANYLMQKTTYYFAARLLKLSYNYQSSNPNHATNKIGNKILYVISQLVSIFIRGPRVTLKFILSGGLIFVCFLPVIAATRRMIPKKILFFTLLFLYSNQIFKILRIKIIADPKLVNLVKRKLAQSPTDDTKIYKLAVMVTQFEIDSSSSGLAKNFVLNVNARTLFSKQRIIKLNSLISNLFHSEGYFESAAVIERLCKEILDKGTYRKPGNYFESNYATAIGHISLMDMIIKGRKLGMLSSNTFNIIVDNNKIVNRLYFETLEKEAIKCGISFVNGCNDNLLEPDMEMLLNNQGEYVTARKIYGSIEYEWQHKFGKPLINFNEKDSNYTRVENILKKLGVDISKPIIGLHYRVNNDFLKSSRGSNISNIRSTLRYLSNLDLNVIKIGTERTSISSKNRSENYFDICDWNLSREEFELICLYVWSKSIFFIGNLSGGTMPPNTFGTPTFWFDVFPLAHVRLPGLNDYFIPKKVYSCRLQRNLTFSEMFTYPDSQSENPLRLSESGYRLIDVSELDILNGVKSMVDEYLYKNKIVDNDCKVIEYENVYRKNGFPYGAKIDLHFLSDYII